MPNRSRRPRDLNQLAHAVVEAATKEPEPPSEVSKPTGAGPVKDPAAVALGRRGGLKGGRARAEALSPEERTAIAQKAAAARWSKTRDDE